MQARCRILDRVDGIFEHDLLRRMLEALLGEPASVHLAPMLAPAEDATVTKQKQQRLLALPAQIGRRLTRRLGISDVATTVDATGAR